MPQQYTLLHSKLLDECPDSVERCPFVSDLFICCTYELLQQKDESTPAHLMNRKGSVYLFGVESNKLVEKAVIRTEAILDSKWRTTNDRECHVFATCDARGAINFYELHNGKTAGEHDIKTFSSVSVVEDGLALSLDWSADGSSIICSDSNGFLSLVTFTSGGVSLIDRWAAHKAEAWIAAFNTWDENIIYSGADDCKFRGWDERSKNAIFTNSSHEAGVCSIQSNPLSPYIIATGSYDEQIRVWDSRCIRRTPLAQVGTKGGIWRIKWHKSKKDKMVVASMYGGFDVIDFGKDFVPKQQTTFNIEEGALAYGVDWLCNENNCDTIASCTFYNRKLFFGSVNDM